MKQFDKLKFAVEETVDRAVAENEAWLEIVANTIEPNLEICLNAMQDCDSGYVIIGADSADPHIRTFRSVEKLHKFMAKRMQEFGVDENSHKFHMRAECAGYSSLCIRLWLTVSTDNIDGSVSESEHLHLFIFDGAPVVDDEVE